MDDQYPRRNRPPAGRSESSARKRTPPQKSQFLIFYILTLFTGVIICIVVFFLVFRFWAGNNTSQGGTSSTPSTAATPTPSAVAVREVMSLTGVIKEIDSNTNQIVLYDVDAGKSHTLTVEGYTKLKNKYGTAMVFSELAPGDIVEADFDKETGKLDSVTGSSSAWERKHVSGIQVDKVARTVTLGNDEYTYNNELVVSYKGKNWSLDDIGAIDAVTLKGEKKNLWFIEVNKSHGQLVLFNKERIKDGTLEIDTVAFMMLEQSDKVEVLEGTHVAVVKGSNIEPFSKEFSMAQGETVTLDLMDVQVKTGILNLKVNQSGYTVLIDGEALSATEEGDPLVLEYGEYLLRVQKEDYLPWEERVVINQPLKDLTVEIEKEVKLGQISVTTIPEGADVYIDNGLAGQSPVTIPIEYGSHTLLVVKEGYISSTMPVEIKGKDHAYQITLLRKEGATPDSGEGANLP